MPAANDHYDIPLEAKHPNNMDPSWIRESLRAALLEGYNLTFYKMIFSPFHPASMVGDSARRAQADTGYSAEYIDGTYGVSRGMHPYGMLPQARILTESFAAERRKGIPNLRPKRLARVRVLPHSHTPPAAEAAWLTKGRQERMRYWRNTVAEAEIGAG